MEQGPRRGPRRQLLRQARHAVRGKDGGEVRVPVPDRSAEGTVLLWPLGNPNPDCVRASPQSARAKERAEAVDSALVRRSHARRKLREPSKHP